MTRFFFSTVAFRLQSFGILFFLLVQLMISSFCSAKGHNYGSLAADHGISFPAHVIHQDGSVLTVENVRWGTIHAPQRNDYQKFIWKTAAIDLDAIEEVYFLKKLFPPKFIAAHCYIAVTFRKGGFIGTDGFEPEALVISIEALRKPGEPFDFLKGTRNHFGIIHVLSSWEDYITFECGVDKKIINPYKFKIGNNQKKVLAERIILDALKDRSTEYYHLFTNSCIYPHCLKINSVLPSQQQIPLKFFFGKIVNPKPSLPVQAIDAYVKKGVLEPAISEINENNFFVQLRKFFKN
ncbi:MAG: DUF4105 domain-containing protein [Candidatus Riflebacteria bacterium]|nr:DUF4105 domain-containing protein [Candidatus Riflebacteria bacterium]